MYEIFIDESGDTIVGPPGASEIYTVASIVIEDKDRMEIEQQLEFIAQKHLQGGVIKSSNVGNNLRKRIDLLKDMSNLNFTIGILFVDKSKLYSNGFKFKPSFYKYFNNLIIRTWGRYAVRISIYLDQYGRPEFQEQVVSQLKKDRPLVTDVIYLDDKTSRLVQLADLIAGTLFKLKTVYKFEEETSSLIQDFVRKKSLFVESFPQLSGSLFAESDVYQYDHELVDFFEEQYMRFIVRYKNDKGDKGKGAAILEYLIMVHNHSPRSRVTSYNIIDYLESQINWRGKDEEIRKIIGQLREEAIIISSSRNGYKLPSSEQDVHKYINSTLKKVMPMLRRLQQCRRVYTFNKKPDPVEEKIIERLKSYL